LLLLLLLVFCVLHYASIIRLHRMRKMRTTATDVPVA